MQENQPDTLKNQLLSKRLAYLALGLPLGLLILYIFSTSYFLKSCFFLTKLMYNQAGKLDTQFKFVLASLPTLGFLWGFRTTDIQDQIQKTKETTNVNLFGQALTLFHEKDNPKARVSGLLLLRKLRNEEQVFKEEIDLITQEAHLSGMPLSGLNLSGLNLKKANLKEANLQSTNLQRTNLQGANLLRANLQSANLQKAKLQGAHLGSANLQDTDLQETDLRGANLQSKSLAFAQLKGAKHNDKTIFPTGFNPKSHNMIHVK